ncbi:MAG: ZIP family metal transporter [Thermaerobacter sp.]|nr:ZIP family metal transporter [Thermaerobacter sp.]
MAHVVLSSLLAGLFTPVGAWFILSRRRVSPATLSFTLALASGVMVTVVATELVPTGLRLAGGPTLLAAGVAGALLLALLRGAAAEWQGSGAGEPSRLRFVGWFIAIAIALHDIPEGMAIGAGDAVGRSLGIVIAFAIALHNIPEGMSIAAPLALAGEPRRRILLATAAIGLVTPLGTLLSLAIGHLGPEWSAMVLGLASGAMVYVVGRDTLPESLAASRPIALAGTAAGAALMLALAAVHGL